MNQTLTKFAAPVAVALLSALAVSAGATTLQVYVSPNGNDSNSGLSASSAVQTLAQAVQVVEVQRNLTTYPPAVINVASGRYQLSSPLLFHPADSNLTVLGPADKSAIITGGVPISGWSTNIPPGIFARLSPSAQTGVYAAAVPAGNLGVFQRRGGAEPGTAFQNQPAELIVNGLPMSLARFPDSGWATATAVASDGFTATLDLARRTTAIADGWVQGFWSSDSWETWEPLTGAPATNQIQVAGLLTGDDLGPITVGARFAVVNSLEDLNQPGQYYIDRVGLAIYFYPSEPLSSGLQEISQVDGFLADLFATDNLVLQNLVFQASRGQGVQLYGCTYSGLNNCTVRSTQLEGVYLTAGSNNFVLNSQISDTGSCGILSIEGDVPTLTNGGDQIYGNIISDPGRMEQTSRPAVWIRGVGACVASNTIYGCPGQGIMFGGCNHVISANDISHTCMTMSDVGVIYTGQLITTQGNEICLNIIHDVPALVTNRLGGPVIAGVYLDDFTSDVDVEDNIFYNIGFGVLIGGGRSNTVNSNAFTAVTTPVWIDARGMTSEWQFFAPGGGYQTQLSAMSPAELALFEATYPSFLNMINAADPALPEGNLLDNAYFPQPGVGIWYVDPEYTVPLLATGNLLYNGNTIFVNPTIENYLLVSGADVQTMLPTTAGTMTVWSSNGGP